MCRVCESSSVSTQMTDDDICQMCISICIYLCVYIYIYKLYIYTYTLATTSDNPMNIDEAKSSPRSISQSITSGSWTFRASMSSNNSCLGMLIDLETDTTGRRLKVNHRSTENLHRERRGVPLVP